MLVISGISLSGLHRSGTSLLDIPALAILTFTVSGSDAECMLVSLLILYTRRMAYLLTSDNRKMAPGVGELLLVTYSMLTNDTYIGT